MTGRLNPMRLAHSISTVTNGADVKNGEDVAADKTETDYKSNNGSMTLSNAEDGITDSSADEIPGSDGQQVAAVAPRQNNTAAQSQCPSLIGPVPVPGYTEKGSLSWRACNDQVFIDAANNYNKTYGLRSEDPGYITPQLLKAWASIENGGNKDRFLSDPLTANNAGDWDAAKKRITGLQKGEGMTPEKSARAALEWMRYKSFRPGGNGTLAGGLRNYNATTPEHGENWRKPYFDYHPGAVHREWYPAAILGLEAKMLGMVRPQMD